MVSPPSWFGINGFNKFHTSENRFSDVDVPNGPFELVALLDIKKQA